MGQYKVGNGIVDVRVDDRMIHGIVATEWIPRSKATRAMVVNEEASNNEMIRSALRMATPGSIVLSIISPEKAIANLNNNNYAKQRVFVVARSIFDAHELFKGGVEFKRVNLGNVTQNADNDLTVLDKTVRVTKDEMVMLKNMSDSGVLITCQPRVGDSVKNISEFSNL